MLSDLHIYKYKSYHCENCAFIYIADNNLFTSKAGLDRKLKKIDCVKSLKRYVFILTLLIN
jgi:hypothetical protein